MKPRTLILRAAGTNCDAETAYAFEQAGSEPRLVHVLRLIEGTEKLDDYQLLAIPGGFSYGDDISAGRILASQLAHHLAEHLRRFVEAGKPVIGICNGFQVLIKTDLLPGALPGFTGRACTLTQNRRGEFVDRWVRLASAGQHCVWTRGLEPFDVPVAHAEGRFVTAHPSVLNLLHDRQQVALTYARPDDSPAGGEFPYNPNGSEGDVAGICDSTGLVLGLMPHPERHVTKFQHPAWSGHPEWPEGGPGLAVFRNAVRHVIEGVGSGV
jgi:phosphoribosylformylglycinamidine synthase